MNTSQQTFTIAEPATGQPVPVGTLAYFRARLRNRLHSVLLKRFKGSGISQAELATRMGRDRAQVARWLGAPGNMTLDSLSDMLFAIDGSELLAEVRQPLKEPARNYPGPWEIGEVQEFGVRKSTMQKERKFTAQEATSFNAS